MSEYQIKYTPESFGARYGYGEYTVYRSECGADSKALDSTMLEYSTIKNVPEYSDVIDDLPPTCSAGGAAIGLCLKS